MPLAAAGKGIIIASSILFAAGVAFYENNEGFRDFIDNLRREVTDAWNDLVQHLTNGPPQPQQQQQQRQRQLTVGASSTEPNISINSKEQQQRKWNRERKEKEARLKEARKRLWEMSRLGPGAALKRGGETEEAASSQQDAVGTATGAEIDAHEVPERALRAGAIIREAQKDGVELRRRRRSMPKADEGNALPTSIIAGAKGSHAVESHSRKPSGSDSESSDTMSIVATPPSDEEWLDAVQDSATEDYVSARARSPEAELDQTAFGNPATSASLQHLLDTPAAISSASTTLPTPYTATSSTDTYPTNANADAGEDAEMVGAPPAVLREDDDGRSEALSDAGTETASHVSVDGREVAEGDDREDDVQSIASMSSWSELSQDDDLGGRV